MGAGVMPRIDLSGYYLAVREDNGNLVLSVEAEIWGTAVPVFSTEQKLHQFMKSYPDKYEIAQVPPRRGATFVQEIAGQGWRVVVDPYMDEAGQTHWDEVAI